MRKIDRKIFAAVSIMALSCSAHAGYYAGYYIRTGSIDVHLDLTGVGNPATKPAINVVSGSLDQIEYLCVNPSNYNVAPGEAGQRLLDLSVVQLGAGNLVGKGKAVVDISLPVPGTFTCVNPNWTFLPESEVAKSVSLTSEWYACTGDPKVDTDPCYDGQTPTIEATPIDKLQLVCALGEVLRNADGTAVKGQVYTCIETSSPQ